MTHYDSLWLLLIIFILIIFILQSQPGSLPFSRKHPLACWVSCMCSIYSGSILCNFLLGEPILGVFKNSNSLLLATIVWYLIFYSPFDMIYRFCKFLPVKIVLATMKEVIRCKKVHDGVSHAAKLYPTGYIIMAMVGTIKVRSSYDVSIWEKKSWKSCFLFLPCDSLTNILLHSSI